jgi:hypothetical protein
VAGAAAPAWVSELACLWVGQLPMSMRV